MTLAKPYLIANERVGLERDLSSWLIPNDAYPDLEDCYMFRGRIPRREGFNLLGRLVTEIGSAIGGVFIGAIPLRPASLPVPLTPKTVYIVVGSITFVDDGAGVLIGTPGTNTGTVNYGTGGIVLNFSPALASLTLVNYLNLYPVMGLPSRELPALNAEQLIGFDIVKANKYDNSLQTFVDITFHRTVTPKTAPFSWTGTDSDFFWTWNYANAFWTTNNVRGFQATVDATNPTLGDGIRWYDGTGWINFLPPVDSTNFLMGALIIIPFRDYLIALNTTEGTAYGNFTNYPARARWSQIGTPYYAFDGVGNPIVPAGYTGGAEANAWRSDIIGRGGFFDAPSQEQIVGAEFFKDTLIVFFERSTWQLRFTGNQAEPFIWERINVDFGAESTFSTIPFDAGVIAVGNYGIISCDSTGVKRIDEKIPDEVFEIHNGNSGVKRVYGIRDYTKEMAYWTFPSFEKNPIFPNRVLVYNYREGSYSFFNDSLTCFGTYQAFNDVSWSSIVATWESYNNAWNNGSLQSQYPIIVAGNQQGFVFYNYNNGPIVNATHSLYITNITQASPAVVTSPNHNLQAGQIIVLSQVVGMTQVNGNIYRVGTSITANTFNLEVAVFPDPNSEVVQWVNLDSTAFTAYTTAGVIKVRNNFLISSKRFNPFIESGMQVRVNNIDFFVQGTSGGEFSAFIYGNDNNNTIFETLAVSSNTTTGQEKVWVRTFPSTISQFVQIDLTFSDAQIIDPTRSDQDVIVHAMMPWFSPSGRLTYGTAI